MSHDLQSYASVISDVEKKFNTVRVKSPGLENRYKSNKNFPGLIEGSAVFEKPEWNIKMPHSRSISVALSSKLGAPDKVVDKFDILMNDTRALNKMHDEREVLDKNPLAAYKSKRNCFKCNHSNDFF